MGVQTSDNNVRDTPRLFLKTKTKTYKIVLVFEKKKSLPPLVLLAQATAGSHMAGLYQV